MSTSLQQHAERMPQMVQGIAMRQHGKQY